MKVGIVGAGVMGKGIAQVFAAYGNDVILCPKEGADPDSIKMALRDDFERKVRRGQINEKDAQQALNLIRIGVIADINSCELVCESVSETLEAKKQTFVRISEICDAETLLTSNTSSLSVTELSAIVGRSIIGMHFFNPAWAMKLVEINIGFATPPEIVEKVRLVALSIGKTPVEVNDSPGFIVNRVLIPMINEAIGILADSTASLSDIDMALKLGANHPMGPLELCDLIGLDVCLAIMETLHIETGDSKYRANPLLRKMVRAGYLGRKSGKGFYSYGKD